MLGSLNIAKIYLHINKSASRLPSTLFDSFPIKITVKATRVQRKGKESSEKCFGNYKVVQTCLWNNLQYQAYLKSIKQSLLEWFTVYATLHTIHCSLDSVVYNIHYSVL